MNLPISSTRGFFEILMPGIFLLLNIVATLYLLTLICIPGNIDTLNSILEAISNPASAISLAIVIGYPLGVVLRLMKNEKIDSRSAKYIKFIRPKLKNSIFLKDHFFFNNWMKEKSTIRLPAGAAKFYDEFWNDKDTGNGTNNTTFFNFCKTIISKYDSQSSIEIFAAEALSRFLAGSYYALQTSIIFMIANIIFVYKLISFRASIVPICIVIGYLYLLHVILSQFRLLRCKEVDTVFNACFANKEHFEKLFPNNMNRIFSKDVSISEYEARKELLKRIWKLRENSDEKTRSIKLDDLISTLKQESISHPFLSSLYFAGSEVDHPFFIENEKVAIGISVLPEDSIKASLRKKHPHQAEFIIVLQGSINIYEHLDKETKKNKISEYEHYIITKNVCHWIEINDKSESAAFLFIKTRPSEEPRSEKCL